MNEIFTRKRRQIKRKKLVYLKMLVAVAVVAIIVAVVVSAERIESWAGSWDYAVEQYLIQIR